MSILSFRVTVKADQARVLLPSSQLLGNFRKTCQHSEFKANLSILDYVSSKKEVEDLVTLVEHLQRPLIQLGDGQQKQQRKINDKTRSRRVRRNRL